MAGSKKGKNKKKSAKAPVEPAPQPEAPPLAPEIAPRMSRKGIAADPIHPIHFIPHVDPEEATVRIQRATALAMQIMEELGPVLLPSLNTKQRRSLLRVRKVSSTILPQLFALLHKRPNLAPNLTPAEAVLARAKVVEAFVQFAEVMGGLSLRTTDTTLLRNVELYKLGLDVYAIAGRSGMDAQVQKVVEEVRLAMKTKPRHKRFEVETLEPPVQVTVPKAAEAAVRPFAIDEEKK